jgi:hypothetical protein
MFHKTLINDGFNLSINTGNYYTQIIKFYLRGVLIEPKVRDCSFRLHTTLPFPTHLGPLDLYLDSHRSIDNTRGSPLHYRNRVKHPQ